MLQIEDYEDWLVHNEHIRKVKFLPKTVLFQMQQTLL